MKSLDFQNLLIVLHKKNILTENIENIIVNFISRKTVSLLKNETINSDLNFFAFYQLQAFSQQLSSVKEDESLYLDTKDFCRIVNSFNENLNTYHTKREIVEFLKVASVIPRNIHFLINNRRILL